MNIDWKKPFEIAFELGMAAVGWLLVVVIVFIVFAVTYAAISTIVGSIRKKKNPQAENTKKTIFRVVKGKE